MTTHILGISAYYHDSAACLLRDGEIVAAAQEERFTRKKGDAAFPRQAVAYCLRAGGIGVDDLKYVGFYDKPLLKFERILETYLGIAPAGFKSFLMAGPLWVKEKLYLDRQLRDELGVYRRPALRRAPRIARGERVLPLAVPQGRDPHHGRGGRVGHRLDRDRRRQRYPDRERAALARLAGPALLRLHLLPRLQGELGRVQGDGPRPLR